MLQKLLLLSANLFSNLSTRLDQRLFGSSTASYCWQYWMMSTTLVLNSYTRKRIITKCPDCRSDFSNRQVSKLHCVSKSFHL